MDFFDYATLILYKIYNIYVISFNTSKVFPEVNVKWKISLFLSSYFKYLIN